MILTDEQKNNYQRDGYLVIENFISQTDCAALQTRAKELIEQFDPAENKIVFSPKEQLHAKHQYFLDSAEKISFFFEANVFDENGNLNKDKHLSINKIGHAMHDLDPVFNQFSRQPKLAEVVEDLGITNPLLLQSMYICKQPHIGGEVDCHQDSTFLYVKEEPVIGLWFALEDATLENGCLWAIPGGHQSKLKSRSIRNGEKVYFETYDPTPWNLEQMIPLPVSAGSLIVLHGLLPHMSYDNTSAHSRHAYSLHIISGDYPYPTDNWIQRSAHMPLKGF